jgi:micrococcal nuclease
MFYTYEEKVIMSPFYIYRARVTRVVDGDTLVCDIDLGFHTWIKDLKIRLLNYNAPETRGLEKSFGAKAKSALKELLTSKEVTIQTSKSDDFGRYLGNIWLEDGTDLVEKLVKDGYGVIWDGTGTRPAFEAGMDYPIKTI